MKRLLFICCAVASVSAQAPGPVRPRPAEGREPELKPPTIREYKPKSMLVAPQHPVPRAKFPVIDIHSHQSTPISAAEYDRVMKGMTSNNLQILVNLSGASGDRLRQGVDALAALLVEGAGGKVSAERKVQLDAAEVGNTPSGVELIEQPRASLCGHGVLAVEVNV